MKDIYIVGKPVLGRVEDNFLINQMILLQSLTLHCLKSVRIQSYSGPHFPAFGLNTERYGVRSECGKMRTRITLNMDIFHAVF